MASSRQDYLKRYASPAANDEMNKAKAKKKKKKKKKLKASLQVPGCDGVKIVDDDAVWQKEIREEESEEDDDDGPEVSVDIEAKRMQRMEAIKAQRPYLSISGDGSGWVTVNEQVNPGSPSENSSPPSKSHIHVLEHSPLRKAHCDSPDLSPPRKSRHDTPNLSPPRKTRYESPDLLLRRQAQQVTPDLSPPRKSRHRTLPPTKSRHDTPDLLPPRKARCGTPDLSPLRKPRHDIPDLSPPRKPRFERESDASLQRVKRREGTSRAREDSSHRRDTSPVLKMSKHRLSHDLSPPRKKQGIGGADVGDVGERQDEKHPADASIVRKMSNDIEPPGKSRKRDKMTDGSSAGLCTGREVVEDFSKKKEEHAKRLSEMASSVTGRGADTVYRDKHGRRLESLDELLKLQQADEKPKAKPLEWGKGLAQKREVEAMAAEIEAEKEKPFARTRDDPELDKILKERVRWGDPMAHLVKKKIIEPVLEDLGKSEKMMESGFIVPQDVPNHSWLKRGNAPAPNRYGIKPGRHWDGVDRSNGFEKDLFKQRNEKKALEQEAYLWSVSEM